MKRTRGKQGKATSWLNSLSRTQSLLLILAVGVVTFAATAILITVLNSEPYEPEPEPGIVQPEPEPEPGIVQPEPEPDEEEEPEPEPEEEEDDPDEEPILSTEFHNPLTGEPMSEERAASRPIAVVINNVRASMPQHGMTQADIIFETLVEGGATRCLALFQDFSSAGVVGSVRSARPYFVSLVQGFDAIFLHEGGSPQAMQMISDWGVDRLFNGMTGIGNSIYRDSGRRSRLGNEHSLMANGAQVAERLSRLTMRQTYRDGFSVPLEFTEDATPTDGESASRVVVTFSSGKSTTFTYNPATGRYGVSQFGSNNVDGNNNTQLSVVNVIVIRTDIARIAGDDAGRQEIRTTGRGTGYFINGGKYIEINWYRPNNDTPFSFTLTDGTPLKLGIGNSYICIIPLAQSVTFE